MTVLTINGGKGMNQKILEQITEAAKTEPKSTEHLLIKLMEEVGEASQASGSEYKDLSLVDFQEELVDILLVTLTLLKRTEISDEELENLLTKKISKWLEKQGN
jgi:NTP pyrophosphatase (non-canonical NTP hydrolase)